MTFKASLAFQNYPIRQELARQVMYRVYQEGDVVLVNNYVDQVYLLPAREMPSP